MLESTVFQRSQSFTSINLLLPLKQLSARRRRSLATFVPQDGSAIMVQYNGSLDDPELRDKIGVPILSLADTQPPTFTGCPLEAITVEAFSEDSFIAVVTWSEPQAVDNVDPHPTVTTTHNSSSPFSLDGSPHLVTYTATDKAGLRGTCQFDIVVTYSQSVHTVNAVLDDSFALTTVAKPGPALLERYSLMNPSRLGTSFNNVDMSTLTALDFAIASRSKDPAELRALPGVVSFQIAFDLKWNTELILPQSSDTQIDVTLAFDDYMLTSTNTTGCSPLANEHVVAGALAAIDPVTGKMSISGKSIGFSCGFTFSTLHVKVDFPFLTGWQVGSSLFWRADPRNQLNVEVTRSVAAIQAGGSRAAVTMRDTQLPSIENGPGNMTLLTGTAAVATASWSTLRVTDNREFVLELYAFVDETDQVLVNVTKPNFAVGPINVVFAEDVMGGHITVPVQLPLAAPLQLRYVATDYYGNSEEHVFAVGITDNQPPSLELVGTQHTIVLSPGDAQAQVARSDLIESIEDNTDFDVVILNPQSESQSYPVGDTSVAVTVQDAWGNNATKLITITVLDTEAPTADCLPDVSVPAGSDDQAIATWGKLSVSDNTDPRGTSMRIEASHNSGDVFKLGRTLVTMTVFDASNNNVTCQFTVTVSALSAAASTSSTDSTSLIGAGAGAGVLLLVASVLGLLMYRARQRARQPADWDQIFAMIDQLKNSKDGASRPREIARDAMTLLEELGKGRYKACSCGYLLSFSNGTI
jgi:hypothetical protein